MAITAFPPVELANENGLLAIGGDLEVESLLLAYRSGIFPWPLQGEREILWFAPPQRAVLFLDDFHISKSLKKSLRKNQFHISIDTCFEDVIHNCAERGSIQKSGVETWITDSMIAAYKRLHNESYAHSVECKDAESHLVGGLYGVAINGMFAGESMFHIENGASKHCFAFLVDYLRARGVSWIDCQVLTPFLRSLGAVEISRDQYMILLQEALSKSVELFHTN